MTAERIEKLREMAARGEKGERENAKRILEKAGINWQKPKESIINNIKQTFGADIHKNYRIVLENSSDSLLLISLYEILGPRDMKINYIGWDGCALRIRCTPAQLKDILHTYNTKRRDFDRCMRAEARKYINDYLK